MTSSALSDIARVIQLAIAPVFLITGIAGLLSVLNTRLGRLIDRSRSLHRSDWSEDVQSELVVLSRRGKMIYRAITLSTASALLVCCVIAALFISAIGGFPIGLLIAVLFIAAVIALIAALILFLGEVSLATRALRILPP